MQTTVAELTRISELSTFSTFPVVCRFSAAEIAADVTTADRLDDSVTSSIAEEMAIQDAAKSRSNRLMSPQFSRAVAIETSQRYCKLL